MKENFDKRVAFSATQAQYDIWKKSLEQTTYHSMSEFIRSVMDMVCECIRANDTLEVLIIPYEIEDGDEVSLE